MSLNPRAFADTLVVAPAGRLDHESCDAFRADLQPHLERALAARQGIVFDLSGLDYNEARARGGKIIVASPRPVVAEIFQISRFNLIFDVHPTLRQALAAVSPEAAAAYDTR
jgi:anti-anti-sigma regulatory factor